MTREEARLILGVYRCGQEDALDPFFAEALRLASQDAELAKWFAAEQAFDAQIAAGLARDEAPAGLKAALLAVVEPPAPLRGSLRRPLPLPRALAFAAACAVAAAWLTFAFLRPHQDSRDHLADFRAEMVGFLLPPPSLALETGDLAQAKAWLAQNAGAAELAVPAGVQPLPPLGCRTLVFRGHKVGLVCFRRADGRIAHLLVVDRAAFAGGTLPAERELRQVGEWATAAWTERGKLYLLASQGAAEELARLL